MALALQGGAHGGRLPNEAGWVLVSPEVCVDSPDMGIEVVIRAGDGEPAPAFRALAERALADIHTPVRRAKGYLDSFTHRAEAATPHPMAPITHRCLRVYPLVRCSSVMGRP
jgi:hypothetical protein